MNIATFPAHRDYAGRIQIFVSDLSATGVVRNAVAIANQCSSAGYDVRLLTCSSEGLLRDQIDPQVKVVALLETQNNPSSRRSTLKQVLGAYRRHSREWRPDILFSAGNHGHLLSTIAWLGLPGRKILRISNDLDHGHTGGAVALWRALKFRVVTMLADRLVLVSRAQDRQPLLSRMVRTGKALVIPNGVDVPAIRTASLETCPHPWALERNVPIVLAVGRHAKQKNFATLLRAFASAQRSRPMRLIILGDRQADETLRLHNLAIELGVSPSVSFVPACANPFPYFAVSDVLALPSLWEGSSNVLLEALACEIPIVASRTAGDAEQLLANGRFGVLVDPADEHDLSRALLTQTGVDPVYPASRALAFNRSIALEDYLRLFRQCVGNPASNAPRHQKSGSVRSTSSEIEGRVASA